MSGGVLRRGGWLRRIRAGGSGIARLLLLALALQLTVPLLDLGGIAALAGEAALHADLQSSLCHDPGNDPSTDEAPGPAAQVKHCIFCLPMAGDPAATGADTLGVERLASASTIIPASADQVPELSRSGLARSRAPPIHPRTV